MSSPEAPKPTTLAVFAIASLTLLSPGAAAFADSVTVVNDGFEVGILGPPGTPQDDPADPLDVNWGAISNSPTQINVISQDADILPATAPALGVGNTLVAPKNFTFGGTRADLPSDANLSLGIGDKLTVSFDLALFDAVGGPPTGVGNGSGFRFGIFTSIGYGAVSTAGIGSGNTDLVLRNDTTPDSPTNSPEEFPGNFPDNMAGGAGGTQEFTGANDVVTGATMADGLMVDTVYAPVFTVERTSSTTSTYTASINGETATAVDVNDADSDSDYLFDFSEGFFVIRMGNAQSDIRLDNFLVEVDAAPRPDGDYNNDGVVDAADYTAWRDNEGMPAGTLPNDPNGGAIGSLQFDTWSANFGAVGGAPAAAAVPEPTTLAIVGLMAAVYSIKRRQRPVVAAS